MNSPRDILEADLLSSIGKHQVLVTAIEAAPENPGTDSELRLVTVLCDGLVTSPPTTRVAEQSIRIQALAIYLVRQYDQGTLNALSDHWDALTPPVQSQLKSAIYGQLVVLRERARRAHNTTPTQLEEQIDSLLQKLELLPEAVQLKFTDAALNGTLTVSPVVLINKLVMLQEEYPDNLQVMLDELVS